MVILSKIYTKGGDRGQTSLGDGTRVQKDALRVEAYGTVDEANSVLGLVRQALEAANAGTDLVQIIERVQNDLFDLGADLCRPLPDPADKPVLRMDERQVARVENEIDRLNARLQPLTSFVLPGGTPAAAHLHLARTVVRRAERLVVGLGRTETLNQDVLRYLNRLSDLLFVMARFANEQGKADILWAPGAHR